MSSGKQWSFVLFDSVTAWHTSPTVSEWIISSLFTLELILTLSYLGSTWGPHVYCQHLGLGLFPLQITMEFLLLAAMMPYCLHSMQHLKWFLPGPSWSQFWEYFNKEYLSLYNTYPNLNLFSAYVSFPNRVILCDQTWVQWRCIRIPFSSSSLELPELRINA